MDITKAIERRFIDLFYAQKLRKQSIMEAMKLTDGQYRHLRAVCKNNNITEISTESLESLIIPKLNQNPDNETLRMAVEIWKWKHKIPPKETEEDKEIADDAITMAD